MKFAGMFSRLILLGFLFAAVGQNSNAMAQEKSAMKRSPALDPANIDHNVKPSQNFYLFANGKWLKKNPIPPEYSRWGSFSELYDRNMNILHEIVENAAATKSKKEGSDLQLVGDFYSSGMDSSAIEKEGISPLKPYFDEIDAIKTKSELEETIARLQRMGVNILFYFTSEQDFKNSDLMIAGVHQSGLSLPDRDYYTNTDKQSKEILNEYGKYVKRMFSTVGENSKQASEDAQVVLKIEKRLAKASMTRVERRNPKATYNMMTIGKINSMTPGFSWNTYLRYFNIVDVKKINVGQPRFIAEAGKMLNQVRLDDWKIYLKWHLLNAMAPYLNDKFVAERFNFYGKTLTGAKVLQPRWKRVLGTIDREVGFPLGKLYVQKHFSPEAKARAEEMVHNLEAAFAHRIKNVDWMSETTKKQALTKLKAIVNKIGYPDKWKSYAGLEINRGPYVLNVIRSNEFDFNFEVSKIGKPVDRSEWGMTPPTVNAYYDPSMNEIVFPAGILQPPFFNPAADDAVNYGGMGAVIGHEMTHGFDDQGSQFDAKGNLKDWWTKQDAANFKKKAEVLVHQFDSYAVVDSLHINGNLTEGENIADLGGVSIAYEAFENTLKGKAHPTRIDGFTPEQRFFLAWAQMWRENDTPQALRQRLIVDPHSPNVYRCNGPLSDFPAFYEAFDVKPGDPMYRPDSVRAKIW